MSISCWVDKDTIPAGPEFEAWYEEADIPMYEGGEWYDAETGFTFKYWLEAAAAEEERKRKTLSEKAKTARNTAKMFGGKALKGTTKQKEWAEKIRVEKIAEMREDQLPIVLEYYPASNAKFWIEARGMSAGRIISYLKKEKELKDQANAHTRQLNEKQVITERYVGIYKVAESNLTDDELAENKRLWKVYDDYVEQFRCECERINGKKRRNFSRWAR